MSARSTKQRRSAQRRRWLYRHTSGLGHPDLLSGTDLGCAPPTLTPGVLAAWGWRPAMNRYVMERA